MAIYIHDEAARLRLRVTGDLDDSAARELASSWQTASSVLQDRKIVLDLRSLTSSGARGRQLLESLHHLGVDFLAQTPFQSALVAEVTGQPSGSRESSDAASGWLKALARAAQV